MSVNRTITGLLLIAASIQPSLAQDVEAGRQVFARCQACHSAETTDNRLGPHLNGVIGRPVGAVEGFAYSEPMLGAAEEGLVWDDDNLSAFLADPAGFLPGTKMVFPGLTDEADVTNLLAYLASVAS